ncbi:MAG: asparagine synthase (glutamine-hydrolyzing), partial [Candidatus Rokuibacteriota bacterium]
MCGIAGLYLTDREAAVDSRLLKRMSERLTHRGPDDEGVVVEHHVGLAVRRLRIIDLQTGDQPIANEDRTVWIVFNGEIYNYRELRDELLAEGHTFRTRSDTEVLVHLYEEEGLGFLTRVNAMLAVSLWDKKRRRLVLA